jgi:lipid II:glycine glycyltransferase (peptidoglycan interpeptide bridge formation enzyme)
MVTDGFHVVPAHEAASNWDDWLAAFDNRAIRQSYVWGKHKTGGWTPLHAAFFKDGKPSAMALVLTRRAPLGAATLAWANAGPVFHDLPALRSLLSGLTAYFRKIPRTVLRVAPRVPGEPALEAVFTDAGFSPARSPLDSGRTVVVDLRRDVEIMRASLDRKWRNQLKKAESASPHFEFGQSRDLLERTLQLQEDTRKRKKLKDGIDLRSLEKAALDFGSALTFAVGSIDGKDGCAMSWWNFAGRATLWLSAVNETGMKLCLPNAAYWEAMVRLRDEGAQSFDLSGIDAKLNAGVTHFKLGAGGSELVTPGEWDWSASALPRAAFNALLGAVRSRMPR